MGKALYRKYRSKKLSEIIGQEHITTALDNALKNDKISHAYLFTGPRGVGKTSIARILAHEINGIPYDEDATHLDIIEIDAASNRRIDEIRELRERVHNAPASAKYKVYIIDEVHMLTREAFNALLKTLEEPPEHAVFILATTEAHKLPETIVSRTQRYTFRPIDLQKVVDHLRTIAKTEKIKVADEALALIALHGEGSFRDSISLLDQVRNTDKEISLEAVQRSLGIAPEDAINNILEAIATNSATMLLAELKAIQEQGYHAPQIARQLSEQLRHLLLDGKPAMSATQTSSLLKQLLQVPAAHDPSRLLEIILLEATLSDAQPLVADVKPAPAAQPTPIPPEPVAVAAPAPQSKAKKDTVEESPLAPEPKTEKPAKSKTSPSPTASLDENGWQTILQAIKAHHNTLYSVARMAVPSFEGDKVTLAFSFPFHQKRLNEAKNKQVISDIILKTTGQAITLECILDRDARVIPAAQAQPDTPNPAIENISNIFGPTEVIE